MTSHTLANRFMIIFKFGEDRLDAVWLCKVAERQMLRPSFLPPPPIRRLRDLTRYRATAAKR